MIAISLERIVEIVSGELISESSVVPAQVIINDIIIDSRSVKPGTLFVAIKGDRFDGHSFAKNAINAGANALIVERKTDIVQPQIIVKDTRIALGQIACWIRNQSAAKVVALTGSSGKTSVKEMTAAILTLVGSVLYTKGNFNNDIGVPLTLFQLTPEHQFAVIELGANHIGEIAYTVEQVKPESALVTNLSEAHLEGFGSINGVAQAKGEIFNHLAECGTAIINNDSNDLANWSSKLTQQKIWQFSAESNEQVDFYASNIFLSALGVDFQLHSPQGNISIHLPLIGLHNIANALAASALAISVGATLENVQAGLAQCKPVSGRLFPIMLSPGKMILDDSYNANVGSMTAAAKVLSLMPGYRIMVVGDMGELGDDAERCHIQVGNEAKKANIDCVLSVGCLSQLISQQVNNGEHFSNKTELITRLKNLLSQQNTVTILIKGSRSSAMEEIVDGLQENTTC